MLTLHRNNLSLRFAVLILLPLLWLIGTNEALAQNGQTAIDGRTPADLQQGAPAGSFALSGFENINHYNGSLNVALPLLGLGGRGGAGFGMTLKIDEKIGIYRYVDYSASYGQDLTWSAGDGWRVGYGPGVMIGKWATNHPQDGTPLNCQQYVPDYEYNTRLYFTTAEGTEIQLHDKQYGGSLYLRNPCTVPPSTPMRNRGKVFVSADGESMTFISDADIIDNLVTSPSQEFFPSGYLLLSNGTRYRIDNGKLSWLRDRNGNKTTFTYQVLYGGYSWRMLTATDSLNRQVTVSYNDTIGNYDEITYKGFGGAARSIKVWHHWMHDAMRPDHTIMKADQLFPEVYDAWNIWSGDYDFDMAVVSKVELPDGRSYRFYYNSFGEVARVILPTGGGRDYDYYSPFYQTYGTNSLGLTVMRRLNKRTTYNTLAPTTLPSNPPTGTVEQIENYVKEGNWNGPANVQIETRSANNTLLTQSKVYFHGSGADSILSNIGAAGFTDWLSGREYKNEAYNVISGVAGSLLRVTNNTWSPSTSCYCPPPTPPHIDEVVTTLSDTNQVTKQTFSYDQYNNQTDVYEYHYGSGSPGSLARRVHTDYLTSGYDTIVGGTSNPDAVATIHIRSFPTERKVYDAGSTLRSRTEYEYDNYNQGSSDVFHASLVNRTSISGLVSRNNLTPAGGYNPVIDYSRGNATKTTSYLLDNSGNVTGSVSSHAQYDIAGNVVKTLDPRSTTSSLIATEFDFSDRFGSPDDDARSNSAPSELSSQSSFAFPAKVTNVLGHVGYTQFDYYLGKPVNSEDANGVVSSVAYNDALDRPTQAIQARWRYGGGSALAERKQTTFSYDDANRTITVTNDRDTFNDNILTAKSYYDGLGRTWRSAAYEGNTGSGNTWSVTDTQFDALGRVSQVSNPYRAANPAPGVASPPSGTWTVTAYDALSRVITVQTPDTATVTTTYSGNAVTVEDQTGRQRRSLTDALGRLIRVDEPSGCNNCLGSVSSPSQPTGYVYDALDGLRQVTQGSQNRYFMYDSLLRLIRAKNPEQAANTALNLTDPLTSNNQWSIAYSYDAAGNLTAKTDARNISVTYAYDALNRNTTVDYSDTTSINPDISRFYDNTAGNAYGKGRFYYDYAGGDYNAGTEVEHKAIDGYDALGRPLSVRQHFKTGGTWSNGFSTSQTYDLAGNVKTITYPSTRVVNYSYNAAGQLTNFTGKLGGLTGSGGADVNYATAMQYNPRGQMTRETFGASTALYQRKYYNRRGQLFDIRLGTDGSSTWDVEDPQTWQWANGTWNRGALRLFYSANLNDYSGPNPTQADNNGNIHRMDHFVPNALDGSGTITSWVMGTDSYLYDELNRLTQVSETPTGGSGPSFTQKFIYDRWGNRKIDTTATSNHGGGITDIDFTVLTANNRLVAPGDTTGDDTGSDQMRYDKAGNLVYDNYSAASGQRGTMSYDAENRMLTAVNGNHLYRYDADGKRTRRAVQSQLEMWMVYGVGGELVAEYDAGMPGGTLKKEYGYRGGQMLVVYDSTLSGNDQLKWMVTDHLGSARMLVNRSGDLSGIQRRDYLPFGEELASSIGHRNASGAGYVGGNNPRQKFTGYERDDESGLDFAQARYYASKQGRFASSDPVILTKNRLLDPQAINLYTYVRNNPLAYIDPNGETFRGIDGENVEIEERNGSIIILSKNASKDLIRLVGLVNAARSKTATSQFMRLNAHKTMVTVIFAGMAADENGQPDKNLFGLHQPHGIRPETNTPGALTFQDQTGFEGDARIIQDSNGNEVYDEATITIYEGAISAAYGKNKQTATDQLVATFGHEAEHDLDPMQVQETMRRGARNEIYHPSNSDGTPKRGSPGWYSNQILKEIRESRKKRR